MNEEVKRLPAKDWQLQDILQSLDGCDVLIHEEREGLSVRLIHPFHYQPANSCGSCFVGPVAFRHESVESVEFSKDQPPQLHLRKE